MGDEAVYSFSIPFTTDPDEARELIAAHVAEAAAPPQMVEEMWRIWLENREGEAA